MRFRKLAVLAAVLLVGACLRGVALRGRLMAWGDNGAAVMDVGRHLADGQGYRTLRVWTYYGDPQPLPRPEGNRQPLLPMLAAGVFTLGLPPYRGVQTVVLLFGLGTVGLGYLLGKRLFGWRGGLVGAGLLAISPVHVWFSSQVEDQMLFHFFFLLLLLLLETARPRWREAGAGVLCGVAYLSRANGLLLLVALLGLVWWESRRWRPCLLVLGGFLLVSLPWLVRNTVAFGHPLFTENSYFLWAGRFEQVFAVRETVPTIRTYFAEHSVLQALARMVKGCYLSAEAFLLGNIFRREPFSQPSLIPFMLLAWLAYRQRPRTSSFRFAVAALVLHFVSVSWHQHGTFRYYLPFYGWIMIAAGQGALDAVRSEGSFYRSRAALIAVLLAFLLIRPLYFVLGHREGRLFAETSEVAGWLRSHTAPGDAVVDFPHVEKLVYEYRRPTLLAPTGSMSDVLDVAHLYGARFLVVEPDLISWRPQFGAHWSVRDGRPVPHSVPDGLRQVYRSTLGRYLIYEIGPAAEPGP
jgi:4-amino-4-deoxy-L-arabinose transferase-like glycosyltransferase